MFKKQFKTESKKLLDMMVNSIYTHKEIFLRELISNASDAEDKLYFRSLTDSSVTLSQGDYEIRLTADKSARTLTVADNGCGMTREDLENNLGTIAHSGSLDFKTDPDHKSGDIDIIGQFGVGFYSSFMVADRVTVYTKPWGSDEAYVWQSEGADGYTVDTCEKETNGTTVVLHLKEDADGEKYGDYLEEYTLRELVKKYSDYIRYPIRTQVTRSKLKEGCPEDKPEYEDTVEDETLNSMVPLWKKAKDQVTDEEYNEFYREKFFDYEAPAKVIRQTAEGTTEFTALLFLPSHAAYDYYTRDYEKGLQLYSGGVMIMEKCADLLPDYFSFVKGLVDSSDLSLNISREMLQHDRQLKVIAKSIEKKIASELGKMLENERESYEKFFDSFGMQLKYGVYSEYGLHKDLLQDLILFPSSGAEEGKKVTLKEYVSRMKEDQKKIFYAAGDSMKKIAQLPQVEAAVSHGIEVLYLTEEVDEFALTMLRTYGEKTFANVCKEDADFTTDEEKEAAKKTNEEAEDLLKFLADSLEGEVKSVRFTASLQNHPVSLASDGDLSVGMEKTLNKMPGDGEKVKADLVLEISSTHPVAEKLRSLFASDDKDTVKNYVKILYAQARLICGMEITNPTELSDLVCGLM